MSIDSYRLLFRQEATDFIVKVKDAFKIKLNTDARTEYSVDRTSIHYVSSVVRFYVRLVEALIDDTLFIRTFLFNTPMTEDAVDVLTSEDFDIFTHAQLQRYMLDAVVNTSFFIKE